LTPRGRELYAKWERLIRGEGTWEDRFSRMEQAERIEIGDTISELFHDTRRHYHGIDD
jgi:hypothetical protein